MRIVFDLDFDSGAWPGPRGARVAIAGEAWLGPEGLLSALETQLGLGAPHSSLAERTTELVPRLFRRDRFFGPSARSDPWATAHRLLSWRDHLWEYGWRGESLGERRLGELAEATLGLPPGRPERLELVAGWLASRRIDIEELCVLGGSAALSPGWQSVVDALERSGTRVVRRDLDDVACSGNLAKARHGGALASGDSSLQLFRPNGPREGARAVAGALAADPRLGETLFISPDGVLDDALAEFALPVLGAPATHGLGALAELLPITLGLAWSPVDPQLALDWLTLPDLPIDRSTARRLAETLESWPAVGNPLWASVMAERATSGQESLAATVEVVFSPVAQREGEVRVRELLPRIDLLERWAARRAQSGPGYDDVVSQARALRRRFERAELSRLTAPGLDAVLASVVGNTAGPRRAASVGYARVGEPGGVAGPVQRVIWWNFVDTGSLRRSRVALRPSERNALTRAGVNLPSLGDEVRRIAARARRPLLQTEETLILVAPLHNEAGEPAHHHPLLDEIIGRLTDPRNAQHLQVEAPRLRSVPDRRRVSVTWPDPPTHRHRLSLPLLPRAVESPTSLEKFLGCSFAYAVEYLGRVRSRSLPRVAAENRLFGNVAHEVLAEAARSAVLSAENPRERVLDILERTVTTHAALLLLPGYQHDLVLLREAVGSSAELLGRLLQQEQLRVRSVEQHVQAALDGHALGGTPDLVLEDGQGQLVLLDLKWSGETYRREQLRAGAALQLAAYATLLRSTGAVVRTVGYLVLRSQRLLIRGEPIAFAQRVAGDPLDETWDAVRLAWSDRLSQLSHGELFADGVETASHAPVDDALLANGRLVLPPPCRYCELDLLCGRGGPRR